jgi:serine/threonine protein kinase
MPFTICDLNLSPSIYSQGQRGCTGSAKNNMDLTISNSKCLESIKQVMRGVFKGLKDLHSLGITHRDIKLSNILINNDRYPITKVKICDLGSSKKLISNSKDEST